MSAAKATTAGVKVKWALFPCPRFGGYSFGITVTENETIKMLFSISGTRKTKTEARSACCDVLTMLNQGMGIPLADMVEVKG